MSECLDEADVLEYMDSTGTPAGLRAHVQECSACRALLDRLDRGVTAKIRGSRSEDRYTLAILRAGTAARLGAAEILLYRSNDAREPCALLLEWADVEFRSQANDYNAALRALRGELLGAGYDVLCNGSLINFFVSGMAADSGSGLKGYLLVLGQAASYGQLAPTFEQPQEPYQVGTPEDQVEYFEQYLLSLAK